MYRYEIGEQSCAARLGAKDRDGADNGAGRSGTWGWAEEEEEGGAAGGAHDYTQKSPSAHTPRQWAAKSKARS
jgi:hypothetical protein